MKDKTLVIMAAGLGSRFGGLKQVEPVGPNKEFLIDYSIYDAKKCGFNKVVFIIKSENLQLFRETVGKRIEAQIEVRYAFQDIQEAIKEYNLPINRQKPLGTTQAILCAKDFVKEPFVVINADDFYGRKAFVDAANFIDRNPNDLGAVLYLIKNTLSDNGAVKRGICKIENGLLIDAVECSVYKKEDKIIANPLHQSYEIEVLENQAASMNMFVLNEGIFDLLEKRMQIFIKNNKNNLDTCEALIIEDLFAMIKSGQIKIKTLITDSVWYGMTYKQDKPLVKEAIANLINEGVYPKNLWNMTKN